MDDDIQFANQVAKVCIDHFNSLPKKGKPIPGQEWTLLSAIVTSVDSKLSVVAMATGSKCLGSNGMSPNGDLVNDSHAEKIMAHLYVIFMISMTIVLYKEMESSVDISSVRPCRMFTLYQILDNLVVLGMDTVDKCQHMVNIFIKVVKRNLNLVKLLSMLSFDANNESCFCLKRNQKITIRTKSRDSSFLPLLVVDLKFWKKTYTFTIPINFGNWFSKSKNKPVVISQTLQYVQGDKMIFTILDA